MKLYENIVIGNFLFGFGLRLGRNNPELIGVNLLQQSPWDQQLADVLLSSASVCRIIEFKRSASRDKKEAKKHQALIAGLTQPDSDLSYVSLSKEIHWYVEIEDVLDENIGFNTRVVPYYELDEPGSYIDLPAFLELTAQQASSDEKPPDILKRYKLYLDFLVRVNKSVMSTQPSQVSTSPGALVLTASRNGHLRWLTTDNFSDLFHTRQFYDLNLDRELGRQRDRSVREREFPGFGR